MIPRGRGFLSLSLILLGTGASSHAGIYQCTDDKGEASFSDRPCGENAEVVDIDTAYAVPREPGLRDSEREFLKEREERRRWQEEQRLERARIEAERRAHQDQLDAIREAREVQSQGPWWGYPSHGYWPRPPYPPNRPPPAHPIEPPHGGGPHRPAPPGGRLTLPRSVDPRLR